MSVRVRRRVSGRVPPISSGAKSLSVGACWAVLFSFQEGLFFIEDLVSAIEKNFHSFVAMDCEDAIVIGIFASSEKAAAAMRNWGRIPEVQAALQRFEAR